MEVIPFELESLSKAKRYQRWLYDSVSPFLGQRILELGAGIGNLSQHLPVRERLILTDVEGALLGHLALRVPAGPRLSVVQVRADESLAERFANENLDTIVSFNVFEHVERDDLLLRDLLTLLRSSGAYGPRRIVTLVPAHAFAYGMIDKQFGHFRRYSDRSFRRLLKQADPTNFTKYSYRSFYLNVPGLLGWWFTGKLRRRAVIGSNNMSVFEKLCPIIRPLDSFIHSSLRVPFGNSLVTVIEVKNG